MSTRSNIIAKCRDGQYRGIYCHFDGYLTHNGRVLKEAYSTQERVEKLINMGDASYLEEKFEDCVFYHRDRGEDLSIIGPYKALFDCFEALSLQDYTYVWEDGTWKCFRWDKFKQLREFTV